MTEPNLYPHLEPQSAVLSGAFAHLRATGDDQPKWSNLKGVIDCQECAQLQVMTRGAYGPRNKARHRRTLTELGPSGAVSLCSRHAMSWHDQDEKDGVE